MEVADDTDNRPPLDVVRRTAGEFTIEDGGESGCWSTASGMTISTSSIQRQATNPRADNEHLLLDGSDIGEQDTSPKPAC